MGKRFLLKEVPASVIKNSTFTVSPADPKDPDSWDPTDHPVYGPLIGQKAQSVQVSDQRNTYKIGGAEGDLDNLPFGSYGKIIIMFEVDENQSPRMGVDDE